MRSSRFGAQSDGKLATKNCVVRCFVFLPDLHVQKKWLFRRFVFFFSQLEPFESILCSSNWLKKNRHSKKATSFSDIYIEYVIEWKNAMSLSIQNYPYYTTSSCV